MRAFAALMKVQVVLVIGLLQALPCSHAFSSSLASRHHKQLPLLPLCASSTDENKENNPCPLLDPPLHPEATFEAAMGWFWGPQHALDHQVEGILHTVVGYTGSQQQQHHDESNTTPTYRSIQDYAEAVRVTFDPAMIRYEDLVDVFYKLARPVNPLWATTQYRMAIFYFTDHQKEMAEKALAKRRDNGRVLDMTVEPASDFYQAEAYHQTFLEKQKASQVVPTVEKIFLLYK